MKVARLLAVAMCLALVAGCYTMQAYPGPKLPAEEVALIKRLTTKITFWYNVNFQIYGIDGVQPATNDWDIEVLPGEHTLAVRMFTASKSIVSPFIADTLRELMFTPYTLVFQAEKGHSYEIGAEKVSEKLYKIWLEDTETHAIVAGEKP